LWQRVSLVPSGNATFAKHVLAIFFWGEVGCAVNMEPAVPYLTYVNIDVRVLMVCASRMMQTQEGQKRRPVSKNCVSNFSHDNPGHAVLLRALCLKHILGNG